MDKLKKQKTKMEINSQLQHFWPTSRYRLPKLWLFFSNSHFFGGENVENLREGI